MAAALGAAAPGAAAGGLALPASDVGSLLLGDAMKAADRNQWTDAAALARRAPDPLARALVDWRRMAKTGGDWGELSGFLARHPGWPSNGRIRARAEEVMPSDLPPRVVLEFFGDRSPITGRGALIKAAALSASGRDAEARALIRTAWAETPMTESDRKTFLSRHGAAIRDLHAKRVDEMAWRERLTEALDLSAYLSAEERRVIEARAALIRREKGVDGKVKAVPARLRDDPGLAYARFDWRMSKGLEDTAVELLRRQSASAASLGRPEAWAYPRARLAREAFRDGRYRDAYALAAAHRLTSGARFADLEWFAGWVALRKLNDPKTAALKFQTLYDNVSSPISRGRAAYWLARAKDAAGDRNGAAEWRRRAASHDETYYGQLAAMEMSGGASASGAADGGPRKASQATRDDERLRAALALAAAGRTDLGRGFIAALASDLPDAELSALSLQMLDIGRPHYALLLAKAARREGGAPDESLFPIVDLPPVSAAVDPALALAIMRQESEFNPQAVSRVGARGLMQLMPDTARRTAPAAGLGYDKDRLLSDWRYNAALGRTYLAEMLAEFDGSVPLAVAAYNAGPSRVSEWLRRFGDPRRHQIDVIDWVETIPFAETRNYVQRVLEARAVYQRRLTGSPVEQSLARDLFGGRG